MSLSDIVDNSRTDKNTIHSYLELYTSLLSCKRETAKNVLEIGIGEGQGITNGGSIKLWCDYFVNAKVYALDIQHIDAVWDGIKNNERIILLTSTDAYNEDFFRENFINQNIKFDFMLDDGPHSMESMIKFIQLYSQVMTHDGILIIEDVQDWSWIETLSNAVPEDLKKYIKFYDLRETKNRYDDIVFTIDKRCNKIESVGEDPITEESIFEIPLVTEETSEV